MIGRGWLRIFVWALIAAGPAAPVAAQIGAAALGGRIVAQDGGALPGTTVTVVSLATGLSRSVPAGTNGEYVIQGLPTGRYRLRA